MKQLASSLAHIVVNPSLQVRIKTHNGVDMIITSIPATGTFAIHGSVTTPTTLFALLETFNTSTDMCTIEPRGVI